MWQPSISAVSNLWYVRNLKGYVSTKRLGTAVLYDIKRKNLFISAFFLHQNEALKEVFVFTRNLLLGGSVGDDKIH